MFEKLSRKPRFKRVPHPQNFQLTPRDREILRHVARYRFLRSIHLAALTGASQQVISRRLNLLFHHGYLDRPKDQLSHVREHGNQPLVYGLKGRPARSLFIEHTLAVADFMVALESVCAQRTDVRFIDQEMIISRSPASTKKSHNPIYWPVSVSDRGQKRRLGVIPDRLFGLEISRWAARPSTGYFFLEADRGTMPVSRRSFSQTSIARKLAAYTETWRQGIHQRRFGIPRFRVVLATYNTKRANHIIEACRKSSIVGGLFLVTDNSDTIKGIFPIERMFQTSAGVLRRIMDEI